MGTNAFLPAKSFRKCKSLVRGGTISQCGSEVPYWAATDQSTTHLYLWWRNELFTFCLLEMTWQLIYLSKVCLVCQSCIFSSKSALLLSKLKLSFYYKYAKRDIYFFYLFFKPAPFPWSDLFWYFPSLLYINYPQFLLCRKFLMSSDS